MKITIVTISYNQAQFLDRAICSVINQDYPDLEYIVVDPGSTDGSREIIEKYQDRIDKVIFELDDGPADGLNKGFRLASGDIYAYLNSDDLLLPGAVSRFAKAFQVSRADVVSGHGYKIDIMGHVLGKTFSHRFDPLAYLYGACILIQQSTFFRADAFWKVGGFNTANPVSWDGELWFNLSLMGARFKRIGGYWSCFRMHPESITVSGRLRQEENKVKARLAQMLELSAKETISPTKQKAFWLKNRITDPAVSFLRFLEAIR